MDDNEEDGLVGLLEADRAYNDGKVQLESLLGATDALESLIGHLATTPVVTVGHKAAITVSFENLIGNVGLTVADIIPELEGHESGVVSTEALGDHLKELWKRFVALILSVLKSLKALAVKMGTYRGQLRMSAEKLLKISGVRRYVTVKNANLELGMEIKSLVVGGSVLNDPDAIVRAASAALEQYVKFTDLYGPGMRAVGKKFEQALTDNSSYGTAKLSEVSGIFSQMPADTIASKMKAMVYRDPRFGKRLTMMAPPILGGWSLFFLTLEQAQRELAGTNPLAYAQAIRTTGVKFALTNVNTSSIVRGTVRTAGGAQVEAIVKQVIAILDALDKFDNTGEIDKIDRQVKAVTRAGDTFQTRVVAGESSGADESILRFVRNYAGWAIGPVDQMATNLLTVSRNLLTYGRKSLSMN